MTGHHDRHVAVVLSGFANNLDAVARDVGYDDVEIISLGDLVGRRPSAQNRITWRRAIFNDDTWDYGIDALIACLGGPAKVRAVLDEVEPTAAWLRMCVPSIGSPWQESRHGLGNHVPTRRIGLGFDVALFAYDAANATHGLRPAPTLP